MLTTALRTPTPRAAGFTLIELIVTIAIMAMLAALAAPPMMSWIRNNKIRTTADSLQNGLRMAQSEATRRSRQVVFSLTENKPVDNTYSAAADGSNWAISTVTALTGESREFIEAGVLTDVASNVRIEGPAAICFNAIGRLVANNAPGVTGADCALPTGTPAIHTYDITFTDLQSGVDRPLRVTVALGGQVRMCDPAKTLSDAAPDGCPEEAAE